MPNMEDPNGLSDEDYALIGRVVVESVVLEQLVDILMRTCVRDTWISDLFTAGANWSWRYDHARMLINGVVPDEHIRDLAIDWLNRVNVAHARRGQIVHAHWVPGSRSESVTGTKALRGNANEHVPLKLGELTLDEVPDLLAEMHQLRGRAMPVLDRTRESIQSGRKRGLIMPKSELTKRMAEKQRFEETQTD